MTRYTWGRRDSDFPRWKVYREGEKPVALCETEEQARLVAYSMNELAEARVLLAVASNTLAMSQACAILNNITESQVKQRISSCLAKGFK
jgi:hypothetical protein